MKYMACRVMVHEFPCFVPSRTEIPVKTMHFIEVQSVFYPEKNRPQFSYKPKQELISPKIVTGPISMQIDRLNR